MSFASSRFQRAPVSSNAREVELRNFERGVCRIELRLCNIHGLLIVFHLLRSDGQSGQVLGARQIALVLIRRRLAARHLGFGLIERVLKAPLIDAKESGCPFLTFSLS